MVTGCFKTTLYSGFAISLVNLGLNFVAVYHWNTTITSYESNSEEIITAIEGEEASNFHFDSEWFSSLSAEYDNLSWFDKGYVYCDIAAIQEDSSSLLSNGGESLLMSGAIFMMTSIFSMLIAYCSLCCMTRNDGMVRKAEKMGAYDPEALQYVHSSLQKADSTKEKTWYFRSKSLILFMQTGPFLALVWTMVTYSNQLDGTSCQEKFYECGVSGSCSIDDLMAPVALNSSYFQLLTSDTIFAAALAAGSLELVFSFLTVAFLFLRQGDLCVVILPVLMLVLALLPMVWILFIDEHLNLGTVPGILLTALIPIFVCVVYGIRMCCQKDKELSKQKAQRM